MSANYKFLENEEWFDVVDSVEYGASFKLKEDVPQDVKESYLQYINDEIEKINHLKENGTRLLI